MVAASVRKHGRCVGDLRAHHVILCDSGLARVRASWPVTALDSLRMRMHERHGHDDACRLLGVSATVLEHFTSVASRVRGRSLIHEAVMNGIEDCQTLRDDQRGALRAWERMHGRVPNHTLVVEHIERIITPQQPPIMTLPPTMRSKGATS